MKERREELGLTQEQFAEKTGFGVNYISTIERGASFPRCEKLIILLNALETSADRIFADVLTASYEYKTSLLSDKLNDLSKEDQQRILNMVELMIKEAKER